MSATGSIEVWNEALTAVFDAGVGHGVLVGVSGMIATQVTSPPEGAIPPACAAEMRLPLISMLGVWSNDMNRVTIAVCLSV